MTVDLSLLPDGGVGWLDASGQHADIVLSTRIRLARNVEGYAFTGRARDGERLRVLAQVREAVATVPSMHEAVLYRLDELPPTSRALLHERHLVSKELAGLDAQHPVRSGAAVFLADSLGVMVNEEDHLRLQALRSGFALQEAFAAIDKLDRDLGARVPYSFHNEFGFLTACPTNVGTGMRGSVLIHLPGSGVDEGDQQGAGQPAADGADVPRVVWGGKRSRRKLLSDFQPDHAGPIGRGTARSAVTSRRSRRRTRGGSAACSVA